MNRSEDPNPARAYAVTARSLLCTVILSAPRSPAAPTAESINCVPTPRLRAASATYRHCSSAETRPMRPGVGTRSTETGSPEIHPSDSPEGSEVKRDRASAGRAVRSKDPSPDQSSSSRCGFGGQPYDARGSAAAGGQPEHLRLHLYRRAVVPVAPALQQLEVRRVGLRGA